MQRSCFLFGHADTPQSLLPILVQAIEREVSRGITVFYVGYHGNFDHLAATALKEAKHRHAEITIMLLLPYHPAEKTVETPSGFDGTYYPPLEGTPRRYALIKANQYMAKTADSLICYVSHYGNARNLLEQATKSAKSKGIQITNLATDLS